MCHSDKRQRAIRSRHLILRPPFNLTLRANPRAGKTFMKRSRLGEATDAEINDQSDVASGEQ
jgi:hypothetical protein